MMVRWPCVLLVGVILICEVRARATEPDNFPLLRGSGEAAAISVASGGFAEDSFVNGTDGLVEGVAEIIPLANEEWVLLAQTNANIGGTGIYPAAGASGMAMYAVGQNSTNSPYGGLQGMILTFAVGDASASGGVEVGHGNDNWDSIIVLQSPAGVLVTFDDQPISVTAGYGAPLEITLPASPGDALNIFSWAFVPASAGGAHQGFATSAASVVPVETPLLPSVVYRDFDGNVISSWEADPPPPPGDCP